MPFGDGHSREPKEPCRIRRGPGSPNGKGTLWDMQPMNKDFVFLTCYLQHGWQVNVFTTMMSACLFGNRITQTVTNSPQYFYAIRRLGKLWTRERFNFVLCSPVRTTCRFQFLWQRYTLYWVLSSLTLVLKLIHGHDDDWWWLTIRSVLCTRSLWPSSDWISCANHFSLIFFVIFLLWLRTVV